MIYSELLKKKNVVSVGTGYKVCSGRRTKMLCHVVGVTKKVPLERLRKEDRIPRGFRNMVTDVVEVGHVRALQAPTERHRPAMPGVSISHPDVTAGTLGCVVIKNGLRVILSNNHVMANSNDAMVGDPILQPGTYDGGSPSVDTIATLQEFVPIEFGGGTDTPDCPYAELVASAINLIPSLLGRRTRLVPYVRPEAGESNVVDAAIAAPINGADVTDEILGIGKPVGLVEPDLGMMVQKSGRTTGYTTGEILQIGVTLNVGYGDDKSATFINQIITGPMSAGGDSGSAVMDMNRNLVGLLFAGSESVTVLNPMYSVFEYLDLSL